MGKRKKKPATNPARDWFESAGEPQLFLWAMIPKRGEVLLAGNRQVMRGGSYFEPHDGLRPGLRYGFTPGIRYSNLGFRIAIGDLDAAMAVSLDDDCRHN